MASKIDSITLAVIKGGLEQVADEMNAIIERAAFSAIMSEQLDRASGIFHPVTGEVIAQGVLAPPVFIAGMQATTQATLEAANRRGGFKPGDMYIINNPYLGATHLPDVKLVKPVFVDGKLIALLTVCGHWNDIGGSMPGGFVPNATEIHQEGIIINPRPLYKAGELQEDLLGFILDNVRLPAERQGDLQACIAALNVGSERFNALIDRHGAPVILASFDELNDRSENHMRSLIREMPEKTFQFENALDNDGQTDSPVKVCVALTIKDGTMHFDFTGSSAPVPGSINMPRKTCIAACQIAVKHVFPDVPINGGCFRPFTYEIPSNTFLAAEYPRATSGYLESIGRVISAVIGALGMAVPDKAPADLSATTGVINVSGRNPRTGKDFLSLFPAAGGYGASIDSDGLANGPTPLGAVNYPSIEATEHRLPLLVERLALRPSSAGAGRFRGGCGNTYAYKSLVDGLEVVVLGDQHHNTPFGVHGGKAGGGADVLIRNASGEHRLTLRTKGLVMLNRGDELVYDSPGGGGYGDPMTRDAQAVRRDAERGYITLDEAAEVYGVALRRSKTATDEDELEIDQTSSEMLRRSARA